MRSCVSIIALVACTSLANAADLGPYEPYEGSLKDAPVLAAVPLWSGIYVGAHAGWLTGGWDGNMAYSDAYLYPNLAFDGSSKSLDGDGWLGGLQVGFNRQHGAVVWGLEADFSWADLSEGKRLWPYPGNPGSPAWNVGLELDYFGTLRGRLGYLVTPQLLLYGTGGFAWARTSGGLAVVYDWGVNAAGSTDENHFGWAAGVGGEWMVADRWSIKAEWLHVDLGKEDYHLKGTTLGGVPHITDSFPAELEFDVFRVGVNYNFGAGN